MFGLTFEKLILVGIITAVIIGPTRLPHYAQWLADTVRSARRYADATRVRVESELGVEADDWQRLDPRRYDPRRIIREALDDRSAGAGRDDAVRAGDALADAALSSDLSGVPLDAAPSDAAQAEHRPTAVSNDLARLTEISRARAARAQNAIADASLRSTPAHELV